MMIIIGAFILCTISISLLDATHILPHQSQISVESTERIRTLHCLIYIVDNKRTSRSAADNSKIIASKLIRAGSNVMSLLPSLAMKSSAPSVSKLSTPPVQPDKRAVRWEQRIGRASAKGLTMYLQSFAETVILLFAICLVLNLNVLTKTVPASLAASHPFAKLRNWVSTAAVSAADWANISALYAVRWSTLR